MRQISNNDQKKHPGILMLAVGAVGGTGKSLMSNTAAAHLLSSGVSVRMIRLEGAVRKGEFCGDDFIAVDDMGAAENAVGGISAVFEPAWTAIETQLRAGGVAILDAGANAHPMILRMAAETGLSALVEARGGRTLILLLVTRDADGIRQAADLAADFSTQMPEADLILVLNERMGPFVGDHTPEGHAYRELLMPLLQKHPHVTLPFVGAKALIALRGRSILEVLAASEAELKAWSGSGSLVALACQGLMANFFVRMGAQLDQVLPFRAAEDANP